MKQFEAKKIKRSHTVRLLAAPDAVFPLLCPVREEEWIPGWEKETYELIYSKSGLNEEGCIFRTSYPDGLDSLWVCTKFDKERKEAEFLINVKDLAVRKMGIYLTANHDGTSDARFEYTLTALSEKGNSAIDKFSKEAMVKSASGLGTMINYYLQNGKKMNKIG